MTFNKLMKKVEDGDAEIYAWSQDGESAIVITYDKQGRAKRKEVKVTNQPGELSK